MDTLNPSERRERVESHEGFEFRVISYRLGDHFRATADNIDPGAIVARGEGASREEAEAVVVEKARKRLGRMRTFEVDQ